MPGRSLLHVESSIDAAVAGEPVCSIPLKREADAARIVACVNALADVADPAALVASHAEMLVALETKDLSFNDLHAIIERARRAKGAR